MISVDRGQLRLPSFQRGVAWEPKRVVSMLDTVIHDLPLGVALVLDVGEREQFVSRPLESAPATHERPTEHLLDGQQRLTALYRALRDNDPSITYFVHFPYLDDDLRNDEEEVSVHFFRRWQNSDGARYPLWVDSPKECLRRGLVPVRLLNPANELTAAWVHDATKDREPGDDVTDIVELRERIRDVTALRDRLRDAIGAKREVVTHFNLPYLRLPATTSKETALSVFVNMNTNAKPLSAYDIVVAELEGATGRRLKEMEAVLDAELPRLKKYLSLDNAVLQTSALMQGKTPNRRGYFDLDHQALVDNWSALMQGLSRAIHAVEALRIYDGDRLPTAIPIPVIAAILAKEPETGDRRAVVDEVVRRYAWRSFFTNRYEATAASRAAADHRGLSALLAGDESAVVPVFDDDLFPLPSERDLKGAKWAKSTSSLSRAILAASNYFGARDFADDTVLSTENIDRREYHHIFPHQLLVEAGLDSMKALNCVLITWRTNRTIGRLDPITYLENRAANAPEPQDLKDRLESHLVPYEAVAHAGPYSEPSEDLLRGGVQADFEAFLDQRAELVHRFLTVACSGRQPNLRDLLAATPVVA